MRYPWVAAACLAIAALAAAACGSSTTASKSGSTASATAKPASSPAATGGAASGGTLKTAKVGGATVLTNGKGFTLYWFAPDTPTTSTCNGACAAAWPPAPGPATAGSGVAGKIGTIKRSDGATQATYNGHPLYTFTGDHAPGEATGNKVNAFGGLWYEVTASGAAPAASPSHSSPGTGY